MKIFLDVDNTILEHSGFYSIETESRVHSSIGKYPLDNATAIKTMYESSICRNPDIVRNLIKLDFVYFLTKYPTIEYESFKQERVASILGITRDQLLNLKDNQGRKKYIFLKGEDSKVNVVKKIFNLECLKGCYLVDDYSANLIEWENANGIAIKYYNEYNSPNHPTSGFSISNFKVFDFFLESHELKNVLINSKNKYQLDLVTNSLESHIMIQSIDILYKVYEDLKLKLKLDSLTVNQKYDINNFLIEYFNFQDNINPNYWHDIFKDIIDQNNNFKVIQACFDVDIKKLNIIEQDHSLTIKILSENNKEKGVIYDLYLTLDDGAFVKEIKYNFDNLINQLLIILFKQV